MASSISFTLQDIRPTERKCSARLMDLLGLEMGTILTGAQQWGTKCVFKNVLKRKVRKTYLHIRLFWSNKGFLTGLPRQMYHADLFIHNVQKWKIITWINKCLVDNFHICNTAHSSRILPIQKHVVRLKSPTMISRLWSINEVRKGRKESKEKEISICELNEVVRTHCDGFLKSGKCRIELNN